MKNNKETKFWSSLICLIGSMEIIEYFLMAVFAASLEKTIPAVFAFFGFLMLIASNLAFYVYYKS